MLLKREIKTALDISVEATVFTYTFMGAGTITAIARVDVGDDDAPLVGGGLYAARIYINDTLISPEGQVLLPIGTRQTMLQSRQVIVQPGDVVRIAVIGRAGDVSVNTVTQLFDITPARVSDLVGTGPVSVDHDYGGKDNYQVLTPSGAGIQDATVTAYLKRDYDLNRRFAEFVRGRTTTDVNGHWRSPLSLDPEDYIFVFAKSTEYNTAVVEVLVA